jgi:hypothetical protein
MKRENPSPPAAVKKDNVYKNILNPMAQQKLEWNMIPLVERPNMLEGKAVYIINQR